MKTAEQRIARELRAQGCSLKEIERRLGVARSSVSSWVRDVPLSDEQRLALAARVKAGPQRAGELKAIAARAVRLGHQEAGRRRAREGDGSYAAGCMLYWAEGEKRRNTVGMANSDPALLTYFISFLRRHFVVPDEKCRVYCNLFADHVVHQREIEQFWLTTLALPYSGLRKSTINTHSKYTAKKRKNKLPYGTCKLVVHSTAIVQTIYGSIQEYRGFRPEWLD